MKWEDFGITKEIYRDPLQVGEDFAAWEYREDRKAEKKAEREMADINWELSEEDERFSNAPSGDYLRSTSARERLDNWEEVEEEERFYNAPGYSESVTPFFH